MNSAVIPGPGTYRYTLLSRDEIVNRLQSELWESRIGYPETANHIWKIANIVVWLSRERTDFEMGDEALVVRLKYRLQDPGQKAQFKPEPDDWEYGLLARIAD